MRIITTEYVQTCNCGINIGYTFQEAVQCNGAIACPKCGLAQFLKMDKILIPQISWLTQTENLLTHEKENE